MSKGPRFECQPGCTACCEQKGFVYLAEGDIARAAAFLGIPEEEFTQRYVYRTRNRTRLRTPRDTNCFFLQDGGCSIHPAKPTQCRIFPLWPEVVGSPRGWRKAAHYCPGIGKGPLIQIETAQAGIEQMLRAYPDHY